MKIILNNSTYNKYFELCKNLHGAKVSKLLKVYFFVNNKIGFDYIDSNGLHHILSNTFESINSYTFKN